MSDGHRGPKGPFAEPPPGFCPNPGGSGVHTPQQTVAIKPKGSTDLIRQLRAELRARTLAHEQECAAFLSDLESESYINQIPGLHYSSDGILTPKGRDGYWRNRRR